MYLFQRQLLGPHDFLVYLRNFFCIKLNLILARSLYPQVTFQIQYFLYYLELPIIITLVKILSFLKFYIFSLLILSGFLSNTA